jgi:hypothetical protein
MYIQLVNMYTQLVRVPKVSRCLSLSLTHTQTHTHTHTLSLSLTHTAALSSLNKNGQAGQALELFDLVFPGAGAADGGCDRLVLIVLRIQELNPLRVQALLMLVAMVLMMLVVMVLMMQDCAVKRSLLHNTRYSVTSAYVVSHHHTLNF